MPDGNSLMISGGGTTTVATDAMLADAQALALIHFGLDAVLIDLRIAAASGSTVTPLERASIRALQAREQAEELVIAVTTAMQNYSEAEAQAESVAISIGAAAGLLGGAAVSGWALAFLGPLVLPVAMALPWLAREATASDVPIGPDNMGASDDVNQIISNPATVAALRVISESADEAVLGFGGVPALSEAALAAAGITGVSSTAFLLAAYGSNAGLLVESPVSVTRTQTMTTTATTGFEPHLEKIPQPGYSPGQPQIRIDTITSANTATRFEIYIGGTADFRLEPAGDAFDSTSNVAAVAGLPAGSMRAVQLAMADAGVRSLSEVTFTGHSQGGLLAAQLAASGDYNVQGVVTVGAPAGHVLLPAGIPAVIIEHVDDLVPALGGVQANVDALVVQRQAFASPDELPSGLPVPAHQMQYYRETAALMDSARSGQLIDARDRLDAFSAGADSIVSTYYFASREG